MQEACITSLEASSAKSTASMSRSSKGSNRSRTGRTGLACRRAGLVESPAGAAAASVESSVFSTIAPSLVNFDNRPQGI